MQGCLPLYILQKQQIEDQVLQENPRSEQCVAYLYNRISGFRYLCQIVCKKSDAGAAPEMHCRQISILFLLNIINTILMLRESTLRDLT